MTTELAIVRVQLDNVLAQVKKIDDDLAQGYVTQDQFRPVRNIVYGAVTFITLGVLSTLGLAIVAFLKVGAQ